MKPIRWGDEHIQQSSVVNITHVDPTLGDRDIRIPLWLLALLVWLSVMDLALVIGLVAAYK